MRILALSLIAATVLGIWSQGQQGTNVSAAEVEFVVQASGANEVNAVTDGGSAVGVFSFDAVTSEITYDVTVHGLSANLVTAAHIHKGAAGVSGPPVITLSMGGETSFSGSATLTADQVKDLTAGNYYFNVHSKEHPGGFARGRLELPKAATSADKPSISPPSTGDGGLARDASSSRTAWLFAIVAAGLAVSAVVWTARKSS
jgi:hypothetical protein